METSPPPRLPAAARLVLVLGLLYGFLVAISLLGSAVKAMGQSAAAGLFAEVENPFAGLAVGILATVLVQSSSTTSSTIVGLVGQAGPGALRLRSAIPMIMGANIGTTITNTIVSIGHVRQGQEFRRAFAAATVHDFFNLMCVALFLPLELMTGYLEKSAIWLSERLAGQSGTELHSPVKYAVKWTGTQVQHFYEGVGLEGVPLSIALLVTGVALTFFCLVFITKNMRVLISGPLERALNRSLGRAGLIGIVIGAAVTVAVQSSSITTSLLVPLCAAGVLRLENAFPLMLGANIGTTVTAMLASMATDTSQGLTIALVHMLFNLTGVLIFYPFAPLRRLPVNAARMLALRAQHNVLYLVAYVVGVFVVLPLLGYIVFKGPGS